jgi:hypothetical protein
MDIVHFKGQHFSLFPKILPKTGILETFVFTPSAKYEHGDADQWDWNKLCGLVFSWFDNPPTKAVMFGWRWNPEEHLFEVAPYIHDPIRGRIMGDVMAGFVAGESCHIRILRDGDGYVFKVLKFEDWRSVRHEVTFKDEWGRQVAGWFGGNKPAPHFMRIERV